MKDKIFAFLKNKFNISLLILQVIAIVSYFLSSVVGFFSIMFFILEGVFFIVWGIKILVSISNNRYSKEIYDQLPYSSNEKEKLKRESENSNKNNKFIGIALILLGVILIFCLFSLIF